MIHDRWVYIYKADGGYILRYLKWLGMCKVIKQSQHLKNVAINMYMMKEREVQPSIDPIMYIYITEG